MRRVFFGVGILCIVLAVAGPLWAQAEVSAWDALLARGADVPDGLTAIEREVLGLMTAEQAARYGRGAATSEVVLMTGETLEEFLVQRGVPAFDIGWFSVDGGGAAMSGGVFGLRGTVGQSDAGAMSGGDFALVGGLLAKGEPAADPCGEGDAVFCDDFESGGFGSWGWSGE